MDDSTKRDPRIKETWLPYPDFPTAYEVSNQGRVRSLSRRIRHPKGGTRPMRGRTLSPSAAGQQGYLTAQLSVDGYKSRRYIHRMVLETFVCPRPRELVCNHKDGNILNNHVSNLEWITQGDNVLHARKRLGADFRQRRGETCTFAKLTNSKVRHIRRLSSHGQSLRQIALPLGVSRSAVRDVLTGRTWSHVS